MNNKLVLVLEYLNPKTGKTEPLAITRNEQALRIFKEQVLEEAKHKAWLKTGDEVLDFIHRVRFDSLETILDVLIPSNPQEGDDA